MKVLIVGASTAQSIGAHIGEMLTGHGHEVVFASRSAGLGGLTCLLSEEAMVRKTLSACMPRIVVHAAGVYTPAGSIGHVSQYDLKYVRQNLSAKAHGAFVLANVAAEIGCVKSMIFLGGRLQSSDPEMTADCIANAALAALVAMGNKHRQGRIRYHYLDLPLVRDSAMGMRFLQQYPGINQEGAYECKDVAHVVTRIVSGEETREYVLLGEKWTI